jgi:hypothetical protein
MNDWENEWLNEWRSLEYDQSDIFATDDFVRMIFSLRAITTVVVKKYQDITTGAAGLLLAALETTRRVPGWRDK